MAANREYLKKYQFKKGQSGNPGGMRKGELTLDQCKRVLKILLETPPNKLEETAVKLVTSSFEVLAISGILKAIKVGDLSVLESLLDRVFGRPAVQVDSKVEMTMNQRSEIIKSLSSEAKLKLLDTLKEKIQLGHDTIEVEFEDNHAGE